MRTRLPCKATFSKLVKDDSGEMIEPRGVHEENCAVSQGRYSSTENGSHRKGAVLKSEGNMCSDSVSMMSESSFGVRPSPCVDLAVSTLDFLPATPPVEPMRTCIEY
jgi:hypothetical protein